MYSEMLKEYIPFHSDFKDGNQTKGKDGRKQISSRL